MTTNLVPVANAGDILPEYRGTPIGLLLEYHNLGRAFDIYPSAQLLVGMCMDNRKMLRLPENFAYILRAGGANLRRLDFKVSFAVAIGSVRAIALIGHDQCGMVRLTEKRDAFIRGLVENGGWAPGAAAQQFDEHAADFEIDDAAEFVCGEAQRLQRLYTRILVAPLFYLVGEGMLVQLKIKSA